MRNLYIRDASDILIPYRWRGGYLYIIKEQGVTVYSDIRNTSEFMIKNTPRGFLSILFSFMLAMVGFTMLQSLFVLYCTQSLRMDDIGAETLFAAYFSLIFAVPVLGGYLGERFFGHKLAVSIGFVLAMLGMLLISSSNTHLLYMGLACYVLGVACYIPNLWVLLGRLYPTNDPRRDSGFTIIYMGFNVASFMAASSSGYIQQTIGFNFAFFIVFVFSGLALLVFLLSRHTIQNLRHDAASPSKIRQFKAIDKVIGLVILILIWPVLVFLLKNSELNNTLLLVFGVVALFLVLYLALKEKALARSKMVVFLILTTVAIVFWSIYVLAPTVLTLFKERNVNRHFFDALIPTASFISLNPFFIIILGFPLTYLWMRLSRKGIIFSTPSKVAMGVVFMGIGYLSLVVGIFSIAQHGLISLWWIVLSYFFQTLGELFLSPIGYSMVGRLVPERLEGLMMGIWQLATGVGSALSGFLVKTIHIPKEVTDPTITNPIYSHSFSVFGWTALLIGVITLLFAPKMNKKITN